MAGIPYDPESPHWAGIHPLLRERIRALVAASGGRVFLVSGFRTREQQADLYRRKPHLAAPPGKSNHEDGLAVDLGGDLNWVQQNAATFGLRQPMSWEPWHWELAGQVANAPPEAYTTPPDGHHAPQSPEAHKSLSFQVANLAAILDKDIGEQFGMSVPTWTSGPITPDLGEELDEGEPVTTAGDLAEATRIDDGLD